MESTKVCAVPDASATKASPGAATSEQAIDRDNRPSNAALRIQTSARVCYRPNLDRFATPSNHGVPGRLLQLPEGRFDFARMRGGVFHLFEDAGDFPVRVDDDGGPDDPHVLLAHQGLFLPGAI